MYPNYDPKLLSDEIAKSENWNLHRILFYTGIPDSTDNSFWNHFWTAKLAVMGTRGIEVFSRPLRYRLQTFLLPNGTTISKPVGQEKGIDVRIALDIVRLARENAYDVALIFSQDQDLSEAVDEVKAISTQQRRWIKTACAFPISPTYDNKRGINNTEWVKIDRSAYDSCVDQNDYRPKLQKP